MKKIFIICFIGILSAQWNTGFSQSDISMVTHWNNRANYNPATIARPDYIYLFSNVRNQWAGVSGAPKVLNVQASGFVESLNSGFGISLVADKIGLTQALNPTLSYAFRLLDRNENSYSLGISGGIFSRSMNVSGYEPENITDPLLLADFNRIISPDVNLGFEFQSTFFIGGLSTTHLLSMGNDSLFLNSNHRYA
ncbi:MAG TPA: PorP/SprF family type IX secretion system membrane protein, partial [Paludibacter sp.]|nr:PorP/SprF family type IX secretion system membrane protein [Paludibacter sp.]